MLRVRIVEDSTRTSSDFIAESKKGIFCGGIAPPTVDTAWKVGRYIEAKGRKTVGPRIGREKSRRGRRGLRFIKRGILAAMPGMGQRMCRRHQYGREEKQKERKHGLLRKKVNLGLETRRRISLQIL